MLSTILMLTPAEKQQASKAIEICQEQGLNYKVKSFWNDGAFSVTDNKLGEVRLLNETEKILLMNVYDETKDIPYHVVKDKNSSYYVLVIPQFKNNTKSSFVIKYDCFEAMKNGEPLPASFAWKETMPYVVGATRKKLTTFLATNNSTNNITWYSKE